MGTAKAEGDLAPAAPSRRGRLLLAAALCAGGAKGWLRAEPLHAIGAESLGAEVPRLRESPHVSRMTSLLSRGRAPPAEPAGEERQARLLARLLHSRAERRNSVVPASLATVRPGFFSRVIPPWRSGKATAQAAADGAVVEPVKSVSSKEKKRILILISDTGGGHRASAQALEAALDEVRPGRYDVSIVDIWTEHGGWPHNQFVPGYQYAAKKPLLWKSMYYSTTIPPVMLGMDVASRATSWNGFARCIRERDPHLVVSMHPLCQTLPMNVLRAVGGGARRVPFATVVTDLGGAHPSWFHKGVDVTFVPSDAVRRVAANCGLRDQRLRQHGLPVRREFWGDALPRGKLLRELGLRDDKKTVLVVGGGDGVGALPRIVDAVTARLGAECPQKGQVVVICGKNEKMRRRIESRTFDDVDVQVKGFSKRIGDYMEVADCIVTKAGPGTIAEAAIRGLPTMLSSYLPGQEAGNVPFVCENGFGDYSKKPAEIADRVCSWLAEPETLERMQQNARDVAKPHAATQIAEDLARLIDDSTATSKSRGPVVRRGGWWPRPGVPADSGPEVVLAGAK